MTSTPEPSAPELRPVALAARLWREEVRSHWPQLIVLAALVAVVGISTSLYPLVIKRVFDAFASGALDVVKWAAGAVIGVTALRGFGLLGQRQMTMNLATRIEARMQKALFEKMLRADLAQIGRESVPALTQRFTSDFAFVRDALGLFVDVMLRDGITALALVCAMLWFDWQLTLIVLVIAPVFAVPISRLGRRLRRAAVAAQEQMGGMAAVISESLWGIRVAKTYNLEGYLAGRAGLTFEALRRLKMKVAKARGLLDPLLEIGAGLAIAGALLFIAQRIASGQATIGDFMGFLTALFLAAQPVRSLGNLTANLNQAAASLSRIYALMDAAPEIVDRPGARPLAVGPGEVRFEAVHFRYRPDAPALEGVDLVAEAGRFTAIVGRSGSGKSTLAALLTRLYEPAAGRILIDGQDIAAVTQKSLRDAIAYVGQDLVLFDDTIRANIALGRPGAGEAEIVAAAQAAAAHDFISALPEGYDSRVGERGGRLSGGERQRIAIARAILKDAPILLLDEATSALDAESERLVREALARLMKDRTALVIAHRLSTVRDADAIVVMDSGRVVERGSHAALLADPESAYARLQSAQAAETPPEADR